MEDSLVLDNALCWYFGLTDLMVPLGSPVGGARAIRAAA